MTKIPEHLDSHAAFTTFKARCRELIEATSAQTVCDVGGGRTPLFTPAEVDELGLAYTILDISEGELRAAPDGYKKVAADICTVSPAVTGQFDFMFSGMLAEHVRDGAQLHSNIFQLLNPGGVAFHIFPTLFSPVFVANWLLPAKMSQLACNILYPGKLKFPARYSKCFGPTPRMQRFFTEIGYEVVDYRPFYRSGYFEHLPLVPWLDRKIGAWAAARRNPYLTSYVHLALRKPESR